VKNKMQGIPPLHRKLIVELGDAVKYLGEVGSKISTSEYLVLRSAGKE
jgi:hypothetical protein